MEKKSFLMIIVLLSISVSAAMAETFNDCSALSRERTGLSDWKIGLNPESIQGNGQLLAEGKLDPNPDALWGDIAVSSGSIMLSGWPEKSFLDFTFYEEISGNRIYVDPQSQCPKFAYPKDAPPNEQYIRLPLTGEWKGAINIVPMLSKLLLKFDKIEPQPEPEPDPVHICPIVDSGMYYVDGVKVSWAKVSLQRFTGATPEVLAAAIPYVDGQSAPGASWTGYQSVERLGDVAVIREVNWPGGNKEFSIKLVANGGTYWQDLPSWKDTCGDNQIIFEADGVTPAHLYVYLQ